MKSELLVFSTDRLLIRPIKRKDFKAWQSSIKKTLSPGSPFDFHNSKYIETSFASFLQILRRDKKGIKDGVTVNFYAFEKKTSKLIGGSQLWLIQRENCQRATLGYWVLNHSWRSGYGYEIAEGTISHGIKKLALNRIEAEILPANAPSIDLSQKLGMQSEGIRRESIFEDGKWQDHTIFSITASDIGILNRPPETSLKSIV